MSLIQTYLFDTETGYSFDSDKIQIVDDVAKLKLTIVDTEYEKDMSSSSGFTFDSAKAEFVAGILQQKDQTPTDSILASLFSTTDLNWSKVGSLVGTLNGVPTISSGRLVCSGTQGVYYAINNDGVAAIKIKYLPNYSGAPAGNLNIFGIQEAAGTANRIILTHSPSGDNFRITLNNASGTSILNAVTIGGNSIALVSGTPYELELNWNNATGTIQLFIDGVLHGTIATTPWTFGTAAARLYVGAMPAVYNTANASFDDLIFFSSVQHTAGYTAGYSLPANIYAATTVAIPPITHTGLGSILTVESVSTTQAGAPRYNVSIDNGTPKYWNGSGWVDSNDTYSQANTIADFNANIESLNVATAQEIDIDILFTDSNTQSSVDNLAIDYTENDGYDLTNPRLLINAALNTDLLVEISQVATILGSDNIKLGILADGIEKYWNGTSWVANSSLYANTNAVSELTEEVLSELIIVHHAKLAIYFHSEDGLTTPELTSLTVTYQFDPPSIEDILETINVIGYIHKANAQPDIGAKVIVQPMVEAFYSTDNTLEVVAAIEQTVDPDTGGWQIDLVPSENIKSSVTGVSGVKYLFTMVSSTGKRTLFVRTVAGNIQVNFNDLEA